MRNVNLEAPIWINAEPGTSFVLETINNPKFYVNGWVIQRSTEGEAQVFAPDGSMAVIERDDLASRVVREILDAVEASLGVPRAKRAWADVRTERRSDASNLSTEVSND